MFQDFSISQAINYAFKTYYKNFSFFLMIMAGLSCIFFLPSSLADIVLGIIGTFGFVFWCMFLDVLILQNYESEEPIQFNDFFKYDFNAGSYILYSLFLSLINYLPNIFFALTNSTIPQLGILKVLVIILCGILGITYLLGKYLILDRDLTFTQAAKLSPYLSYGAKTKLVITWLLVSLVIAIPFLIFVLSWWYMMNSPIDLTKLTFITLPIFIGCSIPIYLMINVCVYKQLIGQAMNASDDNDLKKQLAGFEHVNNDESDDNEML